MRKILLILSMLMAFGIVHAETEKVCHDKEVKGKTVKECKEVKIHKKLEGTPVPDPKKK